LDVNPLAPFQETHTVSKIDNAYDKDMGNTGMSNHRNSTMSPKLDGVGDKVRQSIISHGNNGNNNLNHSKTDTIHTDPNYLSMSETRRIKDYKWQNHDKLLNNPTTYQKLL